MSNWPIVELLRADPGALIAVCGVLGLMVGSFLNVVILRLPVMIEQVWQADSRATLGLEAPADALPPISLWRPASRCPGCGAPIKPWQNIPVVSWLALRGRCAGCATAISIQYPLVEAISAAASIVCAVHFGWSPQLAAALGLSWTLLALAVIDLNTQLLPDDLCLPLLWAGLLTSICGVFVDPAGSIIGAAAGYLSLWSVYQLFRLLTGKEGMGYGDFKLLAALGAWLGWKALLLVVLLSALVGAVTGIALIALKRQERSQPIPYGPFLAAAGWIAMLWGDRLREAYFHASGMQ